MAIETATTYFCVPAWVYNLLNQEPLQEKGQRKEFEGSILKIKNLNYEVWIYRIMKFQNKSKNLMMLPKFSRGGLIKKYTRLYT